MSNPLILGERMFVVITILELICRIVSHDLIMNMNEEISGG